MTRCCRQGFRKTIRSLDCEGKPGDSTFWYFVDRSFHHLVLQRHSPSGFCLQRTIPPLTAVDPAPRRKPPSSIVAVTTISSVSIPIPHISIRPYRLDRVIGYYDISYEGYGPFMTVRTTLNKHIYQSRCWISGSRRSLRSFELPFCTFLEAIKNGTNSCPRDALVLPAPWHFFLTPFKVPCSVFGYLLAIRMKN